MSGGGVRQIPGGKNWGGMLGTKTGSGVWYKNSDGGGVVGTHHTTCMKMIFNTCIARFPLLENKLKNSH